MAVSEHEFSDLEVHVTACGQRWKSLAEAQGRANLWLKVVSLLLGLMLAKDVPVIERALAAIF